MQKTRHASQHSSCSNDRFRNVPSDHLEAILVAHELWVESDKANGAPADLTGANLQGRDLSRRDLSGAWLSGLTCKERP
jgi:uncharacterized protein YjbI with pentapeptide repeats